MSHASSAPNPLLAGWATPFEVPPFGEIEVGHFAPAFEQALAGHRVEIAAVAGSAEVPTFANTIEALERAGRTLGRISDMFSNLASANTSEEIEAVERDISPKLAVHFSRLYLDEALFRRVDDLFRRRQTLDLSAEQARVLERYHTAFRRAGAHLPREAKERLAAISERLASLGTLFRQNILADEQDYTLVLQGEDDLAGLPDDLRAAAREAAEARGMPGQAVITLSRSNVEPFLQFSTRRDLREKVFRAFIARGDRGGETDNKALIAEIVALRAERARLLGYPSFAHFRLDDCMAKTPQAVRDLLGEVWRLARERALLDREALQKLIQEEGGNFRLAPWDWRYYAEKLRKARHDVDESQIKPYLQLDRVIEAAFYTATQLFGLSFHRRDDVQVWHPDVRVWEVKGPDGRHAGLFFGDYYARPSKHGGAWMTTLRDQERLCGDVHPLVVNIMNFNKATDGAPSLLSYDDARTLFHEFGHALHALLSDVTYPVVSGTSVLTDWVELPSQLYEHWFERPEVLRRFALHYKTGEPMPEDLLRRVLAARTFNQGFATVEYVASALVDLEFHSLPQADRLDVADFEAKTLAQIGMPEEIAMRHRSPHFEHVFASGGYASAYYSYMWSEVLDADAFRAFEEKGDIFDPATARKLRDHVYAAGGSRDPETLYIAFRGRLPTPDALLARRGLAEFMPAGDV
ncbi:MAG: peptidase M3 [Alphaproteobacteria bacterium]|nr:MAG: peptidase M3 [Alphaproteobacteria bacterium]